MQHFNNRLKTIFSFHKKASIFLLTCCLFFCSSVMAAGYTPTTFSDPDYTAINNTTGLITAGAGLGQISLRSALQAADNNGVGPHTITLAAGTYQVTGGPNVGTFIAFGGIDNQNITITGNAGGTTINMGTTAYQDRIFGINVNTLGGTIGVKVTITNVTFTNGHLLNDSYGGGAIEFASTGSASALTLTNCTFTNNTIDATAGTTGGAVNYSGCGTLTVTGCTFSGNTNDNADGGALYYFFQNPSGNQGTMNVSNCTFTNNGATAPGSNGGALGISTQGRIVPFNQNFTANILKNTFTGNGAMEGMGGAIVVDNGDAAYNVNINYNRIVNNGAFNVSTTGLAVAHASGTVNASNNWWGCNTNPTTAGTCNRAAYMSAPATDAQLITAPWITLKTVASPNKICSGGSTSNITASFLINSSNAAVGLSNLDRLIGLPISFTANLGTISGASTNILASGTAIATFTSGAAGGNAVITSIVDNIPAADTTANDTVFVSKPVVVNPATTTGTVGAAFSQTFTANSGVTAYTFSTSSTLPAGLSFTAAGVLSGTPTVIGTFPITVNVSDGIGCTAVSGTYNLVIVCQTITVNAPVTTSGTVGSAFSQNFTQTNAIGSVTYALNSGTLPAGITLAANGTLSGTPTVTGSFPITVKVTDANTCTGISVTYTLVIGCQTITVANPLTTTGTVNAAFSQQFSQGGGIGTTTFSTTSTLPTGFTLASDGTLSGTTTQKGTFPIIVKATDANGCFASSLTYNLVISCQVITVNNPAVSSGGLSTPFSHTFTQTNGVGAGSFTLNSGSLPAGLTLASNGTLSGTPTAQGSFPITVKFTDANGCTGISGTYNLSIAVSPCTLNQVALIGTPASTFHNNSITGLTVPAGTNRMLVVTASDANSLTISGVTYNGNPMTAQASKTDGTAVDAIFTYPLGSSSSSSAGNTIVVTGGSVDKTITASVFESVDQITPVSTVTGVPPGRDSTSANTTGSNLTVASTVKDLVFDIFDYYKNTVAAANSAAVGGGQTFITSQGPLTFTSTTGFGYYSTSYKNAGAGSTNVLRTTTNGEALIQIAVTIKSAPPITITVTNPTSAVGQQNVALTPAGNYTFTASGGTGPYTYATASTLPAGVTLTTGGVLTGTPTNTGSFPITVTASDANGCSAVSSGYTLVINACPVITVTNPGVTTGIVGAVFSQSFSSTGGAGAITYTTSGTLPTGLTLATNGTLSGTPTQSGTFNIVVKANDINSCFGNGATYALVISCPAVSVNAVSNQVVCNGGSTSAVVFSGSPAGTTFNWTNNTPSIGLIAAGSGNIAAFTATNVTNAPIVATITVTPVYGVNCSGAPVTFTITVNPTPTLNTPANQTICNNSPTTAVYFTGNLSGSVCGTATEGNNITLTAPAGAVFTAVKFASYGTPGGSCGNYTIGSCNASNSVAVVSGIILGQNSAVIPANNTTFGDPCNGTPKSLAIEAIYSYSGVSYSWTNNTTSTGLAASGSGNIASFVATNAATAPVTSTITITPNYTNAATSCSGTPKTFTITVNPTATVTAIADQVICNGANTTAVTFSSPTTGGSIVYNWTNNTPSIGLIASGTGNIASFVATNATTAPVTATITVTPSYTNGTATCVGTPTTFTITVNPTAIVDPVPDQTVCGNSNTTALTFSSPATGGTVTYNWTNNTPSIGLGASGNGNIASFVAINSGTTPVVATIQVTPTYTNNLVACVGTPITFTITVSPIPNVNQPASQTVCNTATVAATNFTGSVLNTSFNWVNDNTATGLAAVGSGNIPAFIGTNATGAPLQSNITVTPLGPVASSGIPGQTGTFPGNVRGYWFTAPVSFIMTSLYVPTDASSGNQNIAVVRFTGNTPPPVFSATTNAFTTLFLTQNNTWSGNIPVNIPVAAGDVIGILGDRADINSYSAYPTSINIGGNTVTVERLGMQYLLSSNAPHDIWRESGAGTSISRIMFEYSSTACSGTPKTFSITVNPTASVTTVPDQTVCNGSNTTAVTFSSPTTGGTIAYSWTNNTTSIGLSAGGNGNIPSFVATNATSAPVTATITVTPTYTNNATVCVGTPTTFTITVNPTATVTAVANQTVCNGGNTTAVTFGSPTTGGTITYSWTNSNTSIGLGGSGNGDLPSFVATNATASPITGTITVTPSYTNGTATCIGTPRTFTITVNPPVGMTTPANQNVCNNTNTATVVFSGGPAGSVYNWSNNTTSIGLGTSGTGDIASFVATNATGAPVTATITVTPTFTSGGTTCTGLSTTFTITVNPTATVNAIANQVVCNNSPTALVTFSSPATGGTVTYNWTNNTPAIGLAATGSTATIPSFNATNTGTAPLVATIQVTPTYTNGTAICVGTATSFTITVNPTATVTAIANQVVCNNSPTALVTFSSPTTGGTITYAWTNTTTSIGLAASGSTATIPSFNATNATTAPVVATIQVTPTYTNGAVVCVGTPRSFTITVNPTATVTAITNQVVCNNSPTTLVTFSSPTTGGTIAYNWTNSAPAIGLAASGSTATIPSFNATNTTTGPLVATITVTPTYTNGSVACVGTPTSFTITVNPSATVNAITNQVVCNSSPTTLVTFSSPTTGGSIVYNWANNTPAIGLAASGTSTTIPSFNATNTTTGPLVATITVTPTYTNGSVACVGTPRTFTITVNPVATVTAVPNQVVCNNSPVTAITFTSPTTGGTIVYNWSNNTTSIGLGASGNGNIPTFNGTNTTNAPVTATITVTPTYTNGAVACVGTPATFTISVNPTATVNAIANQVVCNNSPTALVTFSSPTTGGTLVYNWTNSIPAIGLAASGTSNTIPSFTATNTTTGPLVATITVTPSFTNGSVTCIGTPRTFTITVNPTATVTTVPNQTVCHNTQTAAITFTSPTTGGTIVYNWTNNTTSIGLAASGIGNIPAFTATNTSPAAVTATITVTPTYTNGAVACVGTPTTFTITVNTLSAPPTGATTNIPIVCGNGTVTLTAVGGFLGTGAVYAWYSGSCGGSLVGYGQTINVPIFLTTTYFVRIEGTCNTTACSSVPVNVVPQPVVVITAVHANSSAPVNGSNPGAAVTLSATVSPAGNYIYQWMRNGINIPGAVNDTLKVPVSEAVGDYTVKVQSVGTPCIAISNVITLRDVPVTSMFIVPNPNNGIFKVSVYAASGDYGKQRKMMIYDDKGSKIYDKTYIVSQPYNLLDVNISQHARGVYHIIIVDESGKTIASAQVLKLQ